MVSIALLHKDFPYYEDFLGEDKEWGKFFESYKMSMDKNRLDSKYPRLYKTI